MTRVMAVPVPVGTNKHMASTSPTSDVDRLAVAAAIGLLLPNRLLLRCGLRRRLDGWRIATGMVLRGEAATFVLSAFSIDIWSDAQARPTLPGPQQARAHMAERLATFLSGERE